jgi:Flp pilus assembly protein TadB
MSRRYLSKVRRSLKTTETKFRTRSSTPPESEGGARVKRVAILLLTALAVCAVLVVAYYTVEVTQARRATPAIVTAALQSEMRQRG